MLMKKLSEDHYIICDDSEIKEGDYCTTHLNIIDVGKIHNSYTIFNPQNKEHLGLLKSCKKITHSTQPESLGVGWMQSVLPILLSEVKELLGILDVEKSMWYERNLQNPYPSDSPSNTGFNKGFELGYNQALEDNKERKYTEEDMRKAMRFGSMRNKLTISELESSLQQLIQSLQPKTEWEVEFVNGKLKLKS